MILQTYSPGKYLSTTATVEIAIHMYFLYCYLISHVLSSSNQIACFQ